MTASIRAGEVLAGRYRMVDLLGEAKGGWFWCAHDEILHRPVAVHLLAAGDDRADVLMDAARRAAVLNDRRNLRVLDADTTDRLAYVVNEWGQGESLDLLLAEGPMSPYRAAWMVSEVADTIARAHAAGVSHDQLTPEHVLLDENGQVRIIGLAVDAALHGVPAHRAEEDVTHLGSLLYAALTGKWPGPGHSELAPAPTEHDKVLRPRQVRAGIPRALDRICDEMLLGGHHSRSLGLGAMLGHRDEHDLTTAQGVRDALEEFLADPSAQAAVGAAQEEHHNGNGRRGVPVMPPAPEWSPRRSQPASAPSSGPSFADQTADSSTTAPGTASDDGSTPTPTPTTGSNGQAGHVEVPTEAGMPVFHEEDVEWLRARAHKPDPPPAFDEAAERPLFAPDPADGQPARRSRPTPARPHHGDDYWPWDTGAGNGPPSLTGSGMMRRVEEPVPGRSMMRLAWLVAFSAFLVLIVAAAYQFGLTSNDDTPPDDAPTSPSAVAPTTTTLTATARDFDPQGDPAEENPDAAPLAVDDDPSTAWTTSSYKQQFGPDGFKTGVGLVLDLDGATAVRQVQITVLGGETAAQVYVTDQAPTSLDGLEPVGAGASDGVITVTLPEPVRGSHVVVWLTKVPSGPDGFRGQVAEVEVFG
ncbi:protein kinase family protein [Nocardioides jishulii]|uniref:Protein kinase domain-containing protein n=1 Tax=Nocardioides jishulii TaxID=2575440 RepID=A0A4U2YVF3_9ACTN|nr:protein kinase family protein [Nocardioides jishulii]QCX28988.1 hypothetical protein FCL41_16780 [Nocardioides jishulii]TKI64111.1 hypothetical protein FC770_02785 [Nocardioides jishulii]